jgi:hypothetical protein
VRRLRVRLALEVRSPNVACGASSIWASRTKGGRLAISLAHDDFPALLAEALDAVAAYGYDVSRAANQLEVSMSQLIRFLQQEPMAWVHVNDSRRQLGLRPLH